MRVGRGSSPNPRRGCCHLQPKPFPLFPSEFHFSRCALLKKPLRSGGGLFGVSVCPVYDSALQEHTFFPRPGFNKALQQGLSPRGCCLGLVWLSAALGLDKALLNSARGRKVGSWVSSTNMIFILFFSRPPAWWLSHSYCEFVSNRGLMAPHYREKQAPLSPGEREKPCPTSCSTNCNTASVRVDIMTWRALPLGFTWGFHASCL